MITKAFPAFKYKNYQIFFVSQIISLIGTWMQMVAQGYFVFQLTHSAFWVGAVTALGYLPSTFFVLIGGTIVDSFPKKNILQATQGLSFLLASLLGILIITGHINLVSLSVLAFLLGLVNAVDQPARLAIVIDLVDKKYLHSATALNMSVFNSARIIGPALAGWLIFAFGVGWVFLLNGISFLAPFIAFNFIKFAPFVPKPHPGTVNAIKQGLRYAFTHPRIKYLLLYLGVISIFGWSYVTILPVVAANVFQKDATGLGFFYSAAGAGSVLGALVMSAVSRMSRSSALILAGGLIFSFSLFIFSLIGNYFIALAMLFIGGFGMTAQNATAQTTIQRLIDDNFRGRVLSIQSLMLMGLHPIGSLQAGIVTEHFGPQFAIGLGATVIFVCAILLYLKRPQYSIITSNESYISRQKFEKYRRVG